MGDTLPPKDEFVQQLVQFNHQCDQMMFWINYKEVIVWPEELRLAKESDAALKAKYAQFELELADQEIRVNEVLKLAELMLENGHPDDTVIRRRREELKQSWQRMRKLALKRQMDAPELADSQPAQVGQEKGAPKLKDVAAEAKQLRGLLEDFLHLEQFEKDCQVTKGWMERAMVRMLDEEHLDPTNLNTKVENHKKLEQEVVSRTLGVEVLVKIEAHLKVVLKMWEDLLVATEIKSVHMSQAWQLDKFNRGVDNMNVWLDEVEATLRSQEFGSDLAKTELFVKEHALVIEDIATHKDIVDIITTAAQQFTESGHYELSSIIARKDAVIKRFEGLNGLLDERLRKLNDTKKAHFLFQEIEAEEKWITQKYLVIGDRGNDIETIRGMIRDTQAILSELQSRDPNVQRMVETGQKLAKDHHLAEEIKKRIQDLSDHWLALKAKAFERKQANQLVLLFLFSIKD